MFKSMVLSGKRHGWYVKNISVFRQIPLIACLKASVLRIYFYLPNRSIDWYQVNFTDTISYSEEYSEDQVTVVDDNPIAVHCILIRTCLLAPD